MLDIYRSYSSTGASSTSETKSVEERSAQRQQQDAMMYALFELLDSIRVRQESAQTQAKILQTNANDQQKLNSLAGQLNFEDLSWGALHTKEVVLSSSGPQQSVWVTKKVNTKMLTEMKMANQEIEKQRTFIGNQLMLEQQNAQVTETNFSSRINQQEQSEQIGSSLLQTLQTLTTKISSSATG